MTDGTVRWDGLAVAIPTFHRNQGLGDVLRSITDQTRWPERVVVIDNSGTDVAAALVRDFWVQVPMRVEYLPLTENSGPAGSFHVAADRLAEDGAEWMMCRGDDNPFRDPEAIDRMYQFAQDVAHRQPAGIGTLGGWYDKRRGINLRTTVADLEGAATSLEVDYIPGLGTPTYHLASLREAHANFESNLFFGLEELHLGLQLRAAGKTLLVDPTQGPEVLAAANQASLGRTGRVEGRRTSEWRTYFSHRNRLLVARSYGTQLAASHLTIRSLLQAARVGVRRERSSARAIAYGVRDGLRSSDAGVRSRYIPKHTAG